MTQGAAVPSNEFVTNRARIAMGPKGLIISLVARRSPRWIQGASICSSPKANRPAYVEETAATNIKCDADSFDRDPAPGEQKQCWCQEGAGVLSGPWGLQVVEQQKVFANTVPASDAGHGVRDMERDIMGAWGLVGAWWWRGGMIGCRG